MLVLIAWKNIWRNKARSLVVLTSIVLGIWAGTFIMSFSWGMTTQYVNLAIKQEISHIQLHNPDYKKDKNIRFVIANAEQILAGIEKTDGVKAASARTIVTGMASSTTNGVAATIMGISPEQENKLTGMGANIIEGDYFAQSRHNAIVMGEKMVSKLKVKLGAKVVLTFQDEGGNITAGAFRIAGIYQTRNSTYDELNVFARKEDLNRLLGVQDGDAHEIAVLLTDNKQLPLVTQKLKSSYPALLVETWEQIAPDLKFVIGSFEQTMYLFIAIILLALTFGIVNIMLMAVLERVRELGMLMAIGMNKGRIFTMIMLETFFLSLTAGPVGLLLAFGTIHYFGARGIDLSAFSKGLSSYGMDSIVRTALPTGLYFEILLMVFISSILAAIYPSLKAIRLKPVEAIRKI